MNRDSTPSFSVAASLTGAGRYRTGRPEARAARVPDELVHGIGRDPERYLSSLVRHVVEAQRDDLGRAKAIHDWIALNIRYDTGAFFRGTVSQSSWSDTLRGGQSVCEGYASVFEQMCSVVGLECARISGYGRGYGFNALDESERPENQNHAWNAVRVANRWHLLDVTWDAGHVEARRFVPEYSTEYLFLEPAAFLYTHFPADSRWQLVEPAMSGPEFHGLPYLRGRFFASGVRLLGRLRRTNGCDAEVRFDVEVPVGYRLLAVLRDERGRELDGQVLVQAAGTRFELLGRFPRAGSYSIDLFLMRVGESHGGHLGVLGFRASRGSTGRFPKVFGKFHEQRCRIEYPLATSLRAGERVRFRLVVPGARRVQALSPDRRWIPFARASAERDAFEADIIAPSGPLQILTNEGDSESQYAVLLEYCG